jgi:branched-chain amino acid transport system ATP-binding protein
MTPLLSIRGLAKRFGGIVVTDEVDLDVAQGEVHAVIGPNGAGKTTLVGQIAGEVMSDAGRILLDGTDITRWPVARRARAGMGRSYQINSVIPELSVLENVLLAVQAADGHNFRFWRPVTATPRLVDEALRQLQAFGLQGLRDMPAGTLAYGSQRQLELVMALATRPRLLLLYQNHKLSRHSVCRTLLRLLFFYRLQTLISCQDSL